MHSVRSGSCQWCWLFLFLPFFTGCASLISQSNDVVRTVFYEVSANQNKRVASSFEVRGRVSVRDAQQSFSGNVHWQHREQDDLVSMFSPLGQTVAEIKSDHTGATMTTSRQEVFHAGDVEALTMRLLGWRLPLNGLQFWIQGLHSPFSTAAVDLDSSDGIIAIRQDGWEIIFRQYKNHVESSGQESVRPRILELYFGDLQIRMVIDSWAEVSPLPGLM